MATVYKRTGGTNAYFPTSSFSLASGVFNNVDRDDGILISVSDNGTATVNPIGTSKWYMGFLKVRFDTTHNNRANIVCNMAVASAGNAFIQSSPVGKYSRNNSNREIVISNAWFVKAESGSGFTIQPQFKVTGTGTPTGSIIESSITVIEFDIDTFPDAAIFEEVGDTGLYGGTTPNLSTLGTTHLSSSNITLSGNQITLPANKKFLVFAGINEIGRGGRTQRWWALARNGTVERRSMSYGYFRDNNNDEIGASWLTIIQTGGMSETLDLRIWRGDGVSPVSLGGADVDGSTPTTSEKSIAVIELPSATELLTSENSALQALNSTGTTSLNLIESVIDNDAASFIKSNNTTVLAQKNMDALVFANISGAYFNSSTGRFNRYAIASVGGSQQREIMDGNYARGDEGSRDTFGFSMNPCGLIEVNSSDNIILQSIDNGDDAPVGLNPNWGGFGIINLDTLVSGPPAITRRIYLIT
jgi:hypothetical protein